MPDTQTAYPGIIIRHSNEDLYYPGLVNAALTTIASRPVGASLLRSIVKRADRAKFGYTVCINKPRSHAHTDETTGNLVLHWTNKAVRSHENDACNGNGCVTAVYWNPNILSSPDGSRPPFIALAHELIHAMQNLRGTAYKDVRKEEYATVGLAPYAARRKRNENAIRTEHGIAPRMQYSGL
ncbi:MAG TPA: M91 family zinc metallopeptidase [Alphaproteobacteria bacterium]|nr:M91 family zinc metallopeptidase [Alphaproteobacteria bacterium]